MHVKCIIQSNKQQQSFKRSFKQVEFYSMDSKRKPRQAWETRVGVYARKRKDKYRMGTAYAKGEEEKRDATRLAKDGEVFQVWLTQSNA